MKRIKVKFDKVLRAATAGVFLTGLGAATTAAGELDHEKVLAALKTLNPALEVDSMRDAPQLPGFVEVALGAQVVYVSEDGRYLLDGTLFDITTRTNLTESRANDMRRDMLADITKSEQISFAGEDVTHSVTIFTDIDCGYCRRLHQQMPEYNDLGIEVNYMMFPRAGIGSESHRKAVSVWCSADSRRALTQAKAGTDPEPLDCDNPIEAHYELGKVLGVTGTPAILMRSGEIIRGYVPPTTLLQRLQASGN